MNYEFHLICWLHVRSFSMHRHISDRNLQIEHIRSTVWNWREYWLNKEKKCLICGEKSRRLLRGDWSKNVCCWVRFLRAESSWLGSAKILTNVRPSVVSWEKIRSRKSQFWSTSAMLGMIKYAPVVVFNSSEISRRLTLMIEMKCWRKKNNHIYHKVLLMLSNRILI